MYVFFDHHHHYRLNNWLNAWVDQAERNDENELLSKMNHTIFLGSGIAYFFEHVRMRPLLNMNTRKGSHEVIKA